MSRFIGSFFGRWGAEWRLRARANSSSLYGQNLVPDRWWTRPDAPPATLAFIFPPGYLCFRWDQGDAGKLGLVRAWGFRRMQTASPLPGAAGTRGAVNQLSKSTVRQICTPGSGGLGVGSSNLPAPTRLQACELKYEKCEKFLPTSLRLSDTHCQRNVAAVDYRFIGILDCRLRRPVKGAGEFQRFVRSNGVRVRHPRPLDRLEDGEVHRQGGAHW